MSLIRPLRGHLPPREGLGGPVAGRWKGGVTYEYAEPFVCAALPARYARPVAADRPMVGECGQPCAAAVRRSAVLRVGIPPGPAGGMRRGSPQLVCGPCHCPRQEEEAVAGGERDRPAGGAGLLQVHRLAAVPDAVGGPLCASGRLCAAGPVLPDVPADFLVKRLLLS